MKHECVRKYSTGYPTKEQTLNDSMLLKNTPERWKGIAVCCSAMSLLTFTGCSGVLNILKNPLNQNQVIVGDISAPAYSLSEDDAVRIIAEECELNGIEVDVDTNFEVDAVMPVNIKYNSGKSDYEYSELKTKLVVDGKVKGKNLCFEYISAEDFMKFTTEKSFESVYERFNFMSKYIGTKTYENIQSDSGEQVRIFYEYVAYNKDEAEENLRQQVKAYIEQLKASGVI